MAAASSHESQGSLWKSLEAIPGWVLCNCQWIDCCLGSEVPFSHVQVREDVNPKAMACMAAVHGVNFIGIWRGSAEIPREWGEEKPLPSL